MPPLFCFGAFLFRSARAWRCACWLPLSALLWGLLCLLLFLFLLFFFLALACCVPVPLLCLVLLCSRCSLPCSSLLGSWFGLLFLLFNFWRLICLFVNVNTLLYILSVLVLVLMRLISTHVSVVCSLLSFLDNIRWRPISVETYLGGDLSRGLATHFKNSW